MDDMHFSYDYQVTQDVEKEPYDHLSEMIRKFS